MIKKYKNYSQYSISATYIKNFNYPVINSSVNNSLYLSQTGGNVSSEILSLIYLLEYRNKVNNNFVNNVLPTLKGGFFAKKKKSLAEQIGEKIEEINQKIADIKFAEIKKNKQQDYKTPQTIEERLNISEKIINNCRKAYDSHINANTTLVDYYKEYKEESKKKTKEAEKKAKEAEKKATEDEKKINNFFNNCEKKNNTIKPTPEIELPFTEKLNTRRFLVYMLNIIDDFEKEKSKLNKKILDESKDYSKDYSKDINELNDIENNFIDELLKKLKEDYNDKYTFEKIKDIHEKIKDIKTNIYTLNTSHTGNEIIKIIKELHFILNLPTFQDIKSTIETHRNDTNIYIDKILYYLQTDFIEFLYVQIESAIKNGNMAWLTRKIAETALDVLYTNAVYAVISSILYYINKKIIEINKSEAPDIIRNKDYIIGRKAIKTAYEVNVEVKNLKKNLLDLVKITKVNSENAEHSEYVNKHLQDIDVDSEDDNKHLQQDDNKHSRQDDNKHSPQEKSFFKKIYEIITMMKNYEEKISPIKFKIFEDLEKKIFYSEQNINEEDYENKIIEGINRLTIFLEFKGIDGINADEDKSCNIRAKNLSNKIKNNSKILGEVRQNLEDYFLKEENKQKKEDFDNFFNSVITNYTLNNILLGILKLINNKLTKEFNAEINTKLIKFIEKSKEFIISTKNKILENFKIEPNDINGIKKEYKEEVDKFIKKLKDLLENENITTFFEIVNKINKFQQNFFPIPILKGIIDKKYDKDDIKKKINELKNNYFLEKSDEKKAINEEKKTEFDEKKTEIDEKKATDPEIINVIKNKTKEYIQKILEENVKNYKDKFYVNKINEIYIKFIIDNEFTELAIYKLLVLSLNLINSNEYKTLKEIDTKITSIIDTLKRTGKILKDVGKISVGATVLLAANKAYKTAKNNSIKKSINIARTEYDNILFKLSNFIINAKTDKLIYNQLIKYADKTKSPRLAVFIRKLANDSAKIEGILNFIKKNPDILTEKNNVREEIMKKINNKVTKYGGRKQNIFKKIKNIMMEYVNK